MEMTTAGSNGGGTPKICTSALQSLLGSPRTGDLCFLRSTRQAVLDVLAKVLLSMNNDDVKSGWTCYLVSGAANVQASQSGIITSDHAVELREQKTSALFFLVDAVSAGSGLDGVYSAGREITESTLFSAAIDEWCKRQKAPRRDLLNKILRHSPGRRGDRFSDFQYLDACSDDASLLENSWMVGLWPTIQEDKRDISAQLALSAFIIRSLSKRPGGGYSSPANRLSAIGCDANDPDMQQILKLTDEADRTSWKSAFTRFPPAREFYVGNWKIDLIETSALTEIKLVPWRKPSGDANAWSGLSKGIDGLLEYAVSVTPNVKTSDLVVRWKTNPRVVPRHEALFEVTLRVAGMQVMSQVSTESTGKDILSAKFRAEDLPIDTGDYYEADITVACDGIEAITERFVIREGDPKVRKGTGRREFRTVAEFVARIGDEEFFNRTVREPGLVATINQAEVLLTYASELGSNMGRIRIPKLWSKLEALMLDGDRMPGSFRARINRQGRIDSSSLKFESAETSLGDTAPEFVKAWRKLLGRVDDAKSFYAMNIAEHPDVDEVIRLWTGLTRNTWGTVAHLNTLRLDNLDGELFAVVMLPTHPVRLAFRMYLDAFVRWAMFENPGKLSGTELDQLLKSIPGSAIPSVYAFGNDVSVVPLVASDVLDLSTQVFLPTSSVDSSLHSRLVRRIWFDDTDASLSHSQAETWKAERLAEEIVGIARSDQVTTVHLNSFAGGDGGTLLAAVTKAAETLKRESTDVNGEGSHDLRHRFELVLFPSLLSGVTERDHLGSVLIDLWELGRKAKSSVPADYAFIFEPSSGTGRFNEGYPLIWRRRDTTELTDQDSAHISVFFDFGQRSIKLINRSELISAAQAVPIYGLAPSWFHEFNEVGFGSWIDYVQPLGNHDRFSRKGTDKRFEEAVHACHDALVRCLNGNPELQWPVVLKELRQEDVELLRHVHTLAEKVVITSPHAIDIYGGLRPVMGTGRFFAGSLGASGLGGGADGVAAIRVGSMLEQGYFGTLAEHLNGLLPLGAPEAILTSLEQLSGRAVIRLTDRNDQSNLALGAATFQQLFALDRFAEHFPNRRHAVSLSFDELPAEFVGVMDHDSNDHVDFAIFSSRANSVVLQVNFVRVFSSWGADGKDREILLDGYVEQLDKIRRKWSSLLVDQTRALAALAARTMLAALIERTIRGAQGIELQPNVQVSLLRRAEGLRNIEQGRVAVELYEPDMYDIAFILDRKLDHEEVQITESTENSVIIASTSPWWMIDRLPNGDETALLSETLASTSTAESLSVVEAPYEESAVIHSDPNERKDRAGKSPRQPFLLSPTLLDVELHEDESRRGVDGFENGWKHTIVGESSAMRGVPVGDKDADASDRKLGLESFNVGDEASTANEGTLETLSSQDEQDRDEAPFGGISSYANSVVHGDVTSDTEVALRASIEPSAVIGKTVRGDAVVWEPRTSSNPHLIITGQSGMGKTTAIMNLTVDLEQSGVVPIIVSFHADVDEMAQRAWGERLAISTLQGGLFNPLFLPENDTEENPHTHIDSSFVVRDLFRAIFPTLGDIQLSQFRDAIQKTYEGAGWGSQSKDPRISPTLVDVYNRLRRTKDVDRNLMLRLDELFAYRGIFTGANQRSFLDSTSPVLLKLSGAKLESIQNAIVVFALQGMYSEMFRHGIRSSIRHVLVIDEAHRLSQLNLLTDFAREARKYGISLLLASQRVGDFSDDLLSNIGSTLFFRANDDDARVAGKYLGTGADVKVWSDRVKQLEPHRAIFRSGSTAPLELAMREPTIK